MRKRELVIFMRTFVMSFNERMQINVRQSATDTTLFRSSKCDFPYLLVRVVSLAKNCANYQPLSVVGSREKSMGNE